MSCSTLPASPCTPKRASLRSTAQRGRTICAMSTFASPTHASDTAAAAPFDTIQNATMRDGEGSPNA